MNVRSYLKTFAIAAVLALLSTAVAPTVAAQVVVGDAEHRVGRLARALEALESRGASAATVAEVRDAIANLPADLRNTAEIQELDALMSALEDPIALDLLGPFLTGELPLDLEDLEGNAEAFDAAFESYRRDVGLDGVMESREAAALAPYEAQLDGTTFERFEETLNAMSDREMEAFMDHFAAFTRQWSESSGGELAASIDGAARLVAAREAADLRAGAAADPETVARYEHALQVFGDLAAEYDTTGKLREIGERAGSRTEAERDAWREQIRTDLTRSAQLLASEENPFAALLAEEGYPYSNEMTGPFAIEDVPVGPVAEAPPLGESPLDALLTPPEGPVSPVVAATSLNLPGAPGVSIPEAWWEDAEDAEEDGDTPSEGSIGGPTLDLFGRSHSGTVDAPDDPSDVYTVRVPYGHMLRIFLLTDDGNVDLEMNWWMDDETQWASRSNASSARPGFDSITFTTEESGDNLYYLTVKAGPGVSGRSRYLLMADAEPYNKTVCSRGQEDCGLNWLRWGDACKPGDSMCMAHEQEFGAPGNHREWAELENGRENPVLFVHGVGSTYNAWLVPEKESWYATKMEREILKVEILGGVRIAIVFVTAIMSFYLIQKAINMGSSGLIGIMFGLWSMEQSLSHWWKFTNFLLKASEKMVKNWRLESVDVEPHFWGVKRAGFETYWMEYNYRDNNARLGQIRNGSVQLKYAVNLIQQDFYDRHRDDDRFPLASPEDVRVDLVVHSMGGLVSRLYTVEDADFPEGPYSAATYEADVNKWISIQTPNMGSSVASLGVALAADVPFLFYALLLSACLQFIGIPIVSRGGGIFLLLSVFAGLVLKVFLVKKALWIVTERPELIRGRSDIVNYMNARSPAPDVDHGIIYGDAIDLSILRVGKIDGLVAEKDALGPPSLKARMAIQAVHEDHGSALHTQVTQQTVILWLSNPDSNPLPNGPYPVPSLAAAATVAAADTPVGRSLLASFGQRLAGESAEPGTRYVPEGGALTNPAGASGDAAPLGDRGARLERLAATKGLEGAGALSTVSSAGRDAAAATAASPDNATLDAQAANAENASSLARTGQASFERALEAAADVAVLRSGHYEDAAALLERVGEPSVSVTPLTPLSDLLKRRVLVVPTGALAGMGRDPYLADTLSRFTAAGGTLLVLAQERGSDFAILPGAPEGFGFAEEDASYEGGVVFSSFTSALAGQATAAPRLHVDGGFTRIPTGAEVLLRQEKNGRAVLATYPVGVGRVVLAQMPLDWAEGADRATRDDLTLVRDLVASARAPTARAAGAPGAPLALALDAGALPEGAANATLLLLDAGAREVARATFPAAANLSWALPENLTGAGLHEVDVLLTDGNGALLARRYGADAFYTAHFAATPDGFRPAAAPALLDVTSASDRIELGEAFTATVRVTNQEAEANDYTVAWWYPAHAAATGDPAYGAGPSRNGAPAAWEDNFRLTAPLHVAPGETATVTVTLPSVERSDAVAVRLLDESDGLLGEAKRTFRAYAPSVLLSVVPTRSDFAAGETVQVTVSAREAAAVDAGDGFEAPPAPVTLRGTIRGPNGAAVATDTATVTVEANPVDAPLAFVLPANAAPGAYVVTVEAHREGARVGSGGANVRLPPMQVSVATALPATFEAGVASNVAYTVRNTGVEAISSAPFVVRLVNPDGTVEWSGTDTVSLVPGEQATVTFSVAPQSERLGTWRLEYQALVGNLTFEGAAPVKASASAALAFGKPTYRVRDTLDAQARLHNDGRFVLAVTATLAAEEGIAPVERTLRLAPGERATLSLAGAIPEATAAGEHAVTLDLVTSDDARRVTRTFTVPPADVRVELPAVAAAVPTGTTLPATLRNAGGVDATVPWSLRLSDATGRAVATTLGETFVPAGGEASVSIAVPGQAATGAYALVASAAPAPGRVLTAQRALQVEGVSGTVVLTAPEFASTGEAVALTALPTSTGAPLDNASLLFTAIHPTPIPAWADLGAIGNVTAAMEHAGAYWFGTTEGVVRRATDGALTRYTVSQGLPDARVTSLAEAHGRLYAGTERGLAWLDGAAWRNVTPLGDLPTRTVLALAGTPEALYVATQAGVVRYDGAAFARVSIPAMGARAIAAEGSDLWAALVDVRGGFGGGDVRPFTRDGTNSPQAALAVGPDGDIHLAYLDNTTTTQSLYHVRLSPEGEPQGPRALVATGPGQRSQPDIAVAPDGTVHVVWQDTRNGDSDIYHRALTSTGAPRSGELLLDAPAGTSQKQARVALDAASNAVIVWSDTRYPNAPDPNTKNDEAVMARVSGTGEVLLPPTRLTQTSGYVLKPVFDLDGDGNVHVAWTDIVRRCDPEFPDICWNNLETFYGKWSPSGAVLVPKTIVSREDDEMSWVPEIVVDGNGDAHIVFQESGSGGIRLFYTHLETSSGSPITANVALTRSGHSARSPALLARPDGRIDVAWTDYRSGRSEGYHNVLDPETGRFAGNDTRINGVPEGATGSLVRDLRLAADATGALVASWTDDHEGTPHVRLAVAATTLLPRGAARVDLATGAATPFTSAGGALPSDDVRAVALDGAAVALATDRGLVIRDRATGALATFPATLEERAPLAVHHGKAYALTKDGLVAFDGVTSEATPLAAGGPARPAALASVADGVLAGGIASVALHRDDRENRIWNASAPATPGASTGVTFPAPAEQGRYALRASLVSETGQVLARDTRDLFVVGGNLTLAVRPSATLVAPGAPVEVQVTAGNRGPIDLRDVRLRLVAGGVTVLDTPTSLNSREARTFTVALARDQSFDLVATATGSPALLSGAAPTEAATARDHVRVEAPAVSARLLVPAVAPRAPLQVDALVSNTGAMPVRLAVGLKGYAPRAAALAPGESAVLTDLARPEILRDTTLTLQVTGDVSLTVSEHVRAGEQVALASVDGAAGAPGERVVTLAFHNAGALPSEFPVQVKLDGGLVPGFTVGVGPNATAQADLALTLATGLHALVVETPWETRTVRLAASTDALPILALGDVSTRGGNATLPVRLENAGPGALRGTLEVDFGFGVVTTTVDLAAGAVLDAPVAAALAGATPGAAEARVRLARDGAAIAEAARAFVVPGPRLAFVETPPDLAANAGDNVTVAYVVENVGDILGSADLRVAFGGMDAETRTLHLAPGERLALTFTGRIEEDAQSGHLPVRATLPGSEDEAIVTVTGASVDASAAPDAAAYPRNATGTLVATVTNPGTRALDLVASATLGDGRAEQALSLAPGASAPIALPLVVREDGEARWTVALASGRVLAEGRTPFRVDGLADTGIHVATDRDLYAAGDLVRVTVSTDREGVLDLLGPGFRDTFIVNGTTNRSYLLPATVPTDRHAMHWEFSATNATGAVSFGVRGVEVRSLGLTLADATGEALALSEAGAPLTARWRVSASVPATATLRTWYEDARGAVAGMRTFTAALPAGETVLVLDDVVPALEPGALQLVAKLTLDASGETLLLAEAAAPFALKGLALREARVEPTGDGAVVLHLDARSASPIEVTVDVGLLGEAVHSETVIVEGSLAREFLIPVPEPGTLPVTLVLATDEGRIERTLPAAVPGLGTPPVTRLLVDGPNLTRDDGVLVITPATFLTLSATDEGSGVAGIIASDDGASDESPLRPAGAFTLAPGWHNLTYRAQDRAGNTERIHRVSILVDDLAPDLVVDDPTPGAVHVAGAHVVRALEGEPVEPVIVVNPRDLGLPVELLDSDGDGHLDAEELVEGSDPADPASTPVRWTPAPPPALTRPVTAVGALQVSLAAWDNGTGIARVALLLDGSEVASATEAPYNWTLDLGGEAPGEHDFAIVATDPLGNERVLRYTLQVVPLGVEGLLATDPASPRLPSWAVAVSGWLQGLAAEAPIALQADAAARVARVEGEVAAFERDVIAPNTPPALTQLPGHIEKEKGQVERALDECECLP